MLSQDKSISEQALPPSPMQQIGLANRAFSRIVDAKLRSLGFAMGQTPVLVALKGQRALSQSELARIARVEQPTMAQILARMERDGIIERVPDPTDKRSRLISLTAEAEKNLPAAREILWNGSNQALDGFSEEEIAQLVGLLQRVNSNLDRMGNE